MKGTVNGVPVTAFLGPERIFMVSARIKPQNQYLTLVSIRSAENTTFECQLDSEPFVPCKYNHFLLVISIKLSNLFVIYFNFLCRF